MNRRVHICSFEACEPVTRRTTYEELKRQVIAAGRFSVFEATSSARASALFHRLCDDPELVTEKLGFPWTGVKLRAEKS